MALVLRRARAGDLPALLDMMEDFNRHEGIAWRRASGTPGLRKLMRTSSLGLVIVAVTAGEPCGYAVLTWGYDLEWNGRDSFLTELYVAAGARRGGVGRALLARVQQEARRGGARAIHLMVRHGNRGARQLYERDGFTSPRRLLLTKPLP